MSRTVAQPPDGASGVIAGSYGDANNIANFIVGSDGRLRSAGNVAISIPAGGVTSITGVASTGGTVAITATPNPIVGAGTLALADTAVTAASYTNADITVDKQGRITAAESGKVGDFVFATTNTAVVYGAAVPVIFNILESAGSSVSYNTGTGVATINATGVYLINITVYLSTNVSGVVAYLDGATAIAGTGVYSDNITLYGETGSSSRVISLTAGNTVTLYSRPSGGGGFSTLVSSSFLYGFSVIRLR